MSLWAGALASAVYLGLAPGVNNPLYRNLLFYPAPYPEIVRIPALEGIEGEDVFFHGDMAQRLHGWLWLNPGSDFIIVFNHGNAGNITIRDRMCQLILRAGYSVLVYDYQGFGRSSGKPSVHGICSDGRAAVEYLIDKRGFLPEQIILYGESLGVSVATNVACHGLISKNGAGTRLVNSSDRSQQAQPFAKLLGGLILQSGFASLRRIAFEYYPFLRIYPPALFPRPALDNINSLRSLNGDTRLLFVHGDLDNVIPVQHSVDMYAVAGGAKKILRLPGTGHSDIYDTAPDEFVTSLKQFVAGKRPS